MAELSVFCPSTNTTHYFLIKPQSYQSYKKQIVEIALQKTSNVEELMYMLCEETIVYPEITRADLDETILPPTFLNALVDKIRQTFYPSLSDVNFFPELEKVPDETVRAKLEEIRKKHKFAYWYKITNEFGLECNAIINKLKSSDRLKIMNLLTTKMNDIFEECFDKYNDITKDKMRQCLIPSTRSAIPLVDGNIFIQEFQGESNFEDLNKSAFRFNDTIISINDSFSLEDEIAQIYIDNIYYCDEDVHELPYAYVAELFNELRREMKLADTDLTLKLSNTLQQKLPNDIIDKLSNDDLLLIIGNVCSEIEALSDE